MGLGGELLALGTEHYRRQQGLVYRATDLAERAWVDGSASWPDVAAVLAEAVMIAQTAAAGGAQDYVGAALTAQGVEAAFDGEVPAEAFGGLVDSALSLLDTLILAPVSVRARALDAGLPLAEAQRRAQLTVVTLVSTAVADAGRQAEGVAGIASPRTRGYVRMLVPPTCARCAVLAGRVYGRRTAFRRHHRCDCRHIPAAESAPDLTTSPRQYFDALSESEQDRVFTSAGAQAIRDGADIGQVVNARQGAYGLAGAGSRITPEEAAALREGRAAGRLRPVTVDGREVYVTTEGTTVRGLAGQRLAAEGLARLLGDRYRRATTPRLMPESIYELADDREHALRLLRRFGYLL
ncbi:MULTISPECIES: hypothetical protein [Actinosynnema]|nr:hypothetical protein [Actinosynnema pretiosum]MCP2098602.1 hypothetical protein [Actinosynnema pretiosum]